MDDYKKVKDLHDISLVDEIIDELLLIIEAEK